jgi:hypothetical protein
MIAQTRPFHSIPFHSIPFHSIPFHFRIYRSVEILLFKILPSIFLLAQIGCGTRDTSSSRVYDAGPIFASTGGSLSHTFQFKNTTSIPLRILGEHHSCSCTDVKLEKRVLKPGESIPLIMTARIAPAYVRLDLSTTIETDPPIDPEATFNMRYECFPEIDLQPHDFDLGSIPWNETAEKTLNPKIVLYVPLNDKDIPGTPIHCESSNRVLKPSIKDEKEERINDKVKRKTFNLEIKVNPTGKIGYHKEQAVWELKDGRKLTTNVYWKRTSTIVPDISNLAFGTVSTRGKNAIKKVRLKAIDQKPFRISRVEIDPIDPDLKWSEEGAGKGEDRIDHDLIFSYKPERITDHRVRGGTIRITSSLSDQPGVEIHWSAFVDEAAFASPSQFSSEPISRSSP